MSLAKEISQKWIKNLRKLDGKYNLDHGEVYSYDGSVLQLEINRNIVKAKVQGIPGKFYDVEIKFNKFSENEIKLLKNLIKNNPLIYLKLLNNEIADELINDEIKIYPDSIDDFEISCSCKNGLFCKHAAALIHRIAMEISQDPLLIFSLRDFEIKNVLHETSYKIKTSQDVLNNNSDYYLNDSGDINYLVKLNFILSDYPVFYPSKSVNFNEVICDMLASMAQGIYQIFNSKVDDVFQEFITLSNNLQKNHNSNTPDEIQEIFEEKWENPHFWNKFTIDLDEEYEISGISTGDYYNNFFMNDLKYPLFAFLAEINQINTVFYCNEIKFLQELYVFTAQLINRNALIPEFFKISEDKYHIRWVPGFEKRIYDDLQYFYTNCPERLLTFNNSTLSGKNQVDAIISLIFEGYAKYYTRTAMPMELSSYKYETFFRLFFLKSQKLSDEHVAMEVDDWLSVLFLNKNDYKLIFDAKQTFAGFDLEFKIKLDDGIYGFDDIIKIQRRDIIKNISLIRNIFIKSCFAFDFSKTKEMNLQQFSFFLDNIAPILKECGVEVVNPLDAVEVQKARLLFTNTKKQNSSLTLNDLVDFDWKVAIGNEMFTVEDFELESYNYRGLIKINDKYIRIENDNLHQIMEDISHIPENPDKPELIRYLLSNDSGNVEIDEKLIKLLDNIFDVKQISVPQSLKGTLRQYQKTGFSWMIQNMQGGFGSILADDMGLGKTIQLLAVILYLKENDLLNDSKVLIIVPTSILTNWLMEIEKFAPSLNVKTYYGINRYFPEEDFDVLLTSYGIVRQDFEDLSRHSWFLIVLDEAQKIKNSKSLQTQAIKAINAEHRIALSGTPVENHLDEYWSIFDFINPSYLKDMKDFKKHFIKPIEVYQDKNAIEDFRKITAPFILRRLKTDRDIVSELPDKIINDVYCNLTLKQAGMYDEALNQLLNEVEKSEGIKRRGLVFKLINSLKQICNHPSQYLKTDDAKINESGKMKVLMNIVENILDSDEKVLIFTQYVHMGEIMVKLIEEKFNEKALFLHGGLKREKRDEMIDDFQNGDVKIFILSLKAGGIGLNLTAASNVIHYDLWWNPAIENQATDRAYRIGQSENVMVYRFITTGTLEEKINQIIMDKRELVDLTIGSDESFITEMSNEELRQMLNLRK